MELSVLGLNLHIYQQSPRHNPWDNAPAGGNGYQHVVGNEEYVDQFHALHPHRFYEPTYRGKIDGWEYREPKRIDYVFLSGTDALCTSNIFNSSLTIISSQWSPTIPDC